MIGNAVKSDEATQERAPSRDDPMSRFSPVTVGMLTLAGLLAYFWLSGALFSKDMTGFWMSSAQTTGMALTYSTSPAFMIAILVYGRRRTRAIVDQFADSGMLDRAVAESARVDGLELGTVSNFLVTVLGLFLGSTNVSWGMVAGSLDGPWMFTGLSMAVGNLVIWVVVVQVITRRCVASNEMRRLGRDHMEIDLLRLDRLLPFGRLGILHVLMTVISVSLSAFQSLDAELRWVNYSSALAAGIPAGVVLLFLPMVGIRQTVRQAKNHALERLDEAIAHADRALEPEALRYLGDLLRQREVLENGREWPLDTTAVSRIAIYVVIPPIAWVGGALVEIFVEAAI
jgi:hypothetical protein